MHHQKTQISDLKQRITFLHVNTQADGQGGSIITWKSGKTVWAIVTPIKESNYMRDAVRREAQDLAGIRYNIRIRAGYDILLPARVQWRGKILTITTKPQLDPSCCWFDFMACAAEEENIDA